MSRSKRVLLAYCLRVCMDLRFDAMLCSILGNDNFDAGQIKCPRGPHLARGLQVKGVRKGGFLGLTPPLELDILQKLY